MELRKTAVFERDIKKLDGTMRHRLKKAIVKIASNPWLRKPLRHLPGLFSERLENYRLVYRVTGDELLLLCFKNREDVYEHVRDLP